MKITDVRTSRSCLEYCCFHQEKRKRDWQEKEGGERLQWEEGTKARREKRGEDDDEIGRERDRKERKGKREKRG